MSNNNPYTRRQIIKASGFFTLGTMTSSPVGLLLNTMTKSFIQNAAAEETNQIGARNYVNLALTGAPLRYQFDHWVRTNSNEAELNLNLMTATKFQSIGDKVTGAEQGYFNYRGVLVPHLFSQSVNTTLGSQNLTDLLNNMLVIRGYGTGLDGHPTNLVRQMAALGGAQSLSGLATDYSQKIFDSIQWPARGGYSVFNSLHGKSLTTLTGDKPAHSLLEGFASISEQAAKAQKLTDRNKDAFDLAKARLNSYIKSDLKGSKILAQNQSHAVALMKKGISNLEGFWSSAVSRYENVIRNAIQTKNIPGISDKNIIADASVMWNLGVGTITQFNPNFDLREAINKAYIANLAAGFALSEYILTEGLGSSIEISAENLYQLTIKQKGKDTYEDYYLTNDMHATGAYTAVFLMNQYYRGISAGILEFAGQLKKVKIGNSDLWSETLLHVVSEFGRSARADGSGSDHGFNQMISSVFGGCINEGPFVVGNVLVGGAQGLAAAIDGYNQKGMPTPAMMASTVASLMRVPKNPFINLAEPLASIQNGKINIKYPGKLKDA